MPDEVSVVVNSEMIDVLAPPAEIRLSVGVGAAGRRGSRFYAGSSSPSVFFASINEVPLVGDTYISVPQQRAYQFVSTPSGDVWNTLFDIAELSPPGGGTGGGGTTFVPDPDNAGLYIISG